MCTKNELHQILDKMVQVYREIYHKDIFAIYLYGSYARGDFTKDSDINIVAVVRGTREKLQEKLKDIWDISSDMELEYGVIVSPTVIPYNEFEIYKETLPYYRNIVREGVKLSA